MGFLFEINSTICGFLYGALIQVCVMFGVHWGFVALNVNNMATLGYDAIYDRRNLLLRLHRQGWF